MNEDTVEQRVLDIYDKATVLWQDMLEELQECCQDSDFLNRFPTHDSEPLPPDFIEYGESLFESNFLYPTLSTLHHYPTLSLTNSSLLFIANDCICNATDMKGYDEDDEDRPLILSYKKGKPAWGTPANQLIRYFYSAHQAFFKTLCMSLKLEAVVRIAEEALADGKVPQIPNTHIK